MPEAVDVGAIEDFPANGIAIVNVHGREIGVVRWADDVYAIDNFCPHQSAPLCRGTVLAGLSADACTGELVRHPEDPVVACAWHGWEFSVITGRCLVDPRLQVRRRRVAVQGGRVLVSPERYRAGEAGTSAGSEQGAVAE